MPITCGFRNVGRCRFRRLCEERSRRSNPFFQSSVRWIASRSLSSGAHSRDPLARNCVLAMWYEELGGDRSQWGLVRPSSSGIPTHVS